MEVGPDGAKLVSVGSDHVTHSKVVHGDSFQKRRPVFQSDLPSSLIPVLNNLHVLFWTGAASFQIGEVKEFGDYGNPLDKKRYLLTELYQVNSKIDSNAADIGIDTAKAWPSRKLSTGAIGFCFGQLNECARNPPGRRQAFVLLSRCPQQRHPYPYVKGAIIALLVSWDGEIAKREALALIEEKEWLKAEPKDELIVLG